MQVVDKTFEFLELLTKEEFQITFGFMPDSFSQELLKEIQSKTSPKNAQNGNLYRFQPSSTEGSRNSLEGLTIILQKLIKLKLIALVFELRFDPSDLSLSVALFFISRAESETASMEIFDILNLKSAKAFENYLTSPKAKEKILKDEVINSLQKRSDPTEEIDELDLFLKNYNFDFLPSVELIEASKKMIRKIIVENKKILFFPKKGFFYFPKEKIPESFQFCLLKFDSNVVPEIKKLNFDLYDSIEKIEAEENAYEEDPVNQKTYIFQMRKAETIREFHKGNTYYGQFIVELILFLADHVQSSIDHKRKHQAEASANAYFNRLLDMRSDLETRFLKIQLEKDENIDMTVLTNLRRNPEVLSAEWNDLSGKVAVFIWKNLENIKNLNKLIYEKPYEKKDSKILHLKEIIETNEQQLKSLFHDPEFVSLYGKNLQKVYLSYIPWYYWIFFLLNVKTMMDAGYSMAKSIIKYEQMDREFKYEQRVREKNKERKKNHKKQLEENKENRNLEYLLQTMDEHYFLRERIPIVQEMIEDTPVLNFEAIKTMIENKLFIVCSKENSHDVEKNMILNSVLLYPNTFKDYSEKNRRIVELSQKIQKNRSDEKNFTIDESQLKRAELILVKMSPLNAV